MELARLQRTYWQRAGEIRGLNEGRVEGRRDGEAEGRRAGREEGRAEGEIKGRREGHGEGFREGREQERREERRRFAVQGANTPKKEKPWRSYARMLALKIKNPTAPDSAIAAILWKQWLKKKPDEWEGEKPDRPSPASLRKFVPILRDEGTLPPRPDRGQGRRPRVS